MKRKKFGLPVGLVAVLAVIGMGMMGVAYAAWSTTLNINGTVVTGTLSAKFIDVVPTDGDGAATNGGTCDATTSSPFTTLSISVDNGYPGYTCDATFKVENNGTIPIDVAAIVSSFVHADIDATLPSCTGLPANDVTVGSATATCTIRLTVRDSASQGATLNPAYTGTVTVTQGLP